MVPTLIVAGIALGVFVGGGFLRAQKRAAGPTPGCTGSSSGGWPCGIRRWQRSWAASASSPARATGLPGAMPIEVRHEPFQNRLRTCRRT